MTGYEFQFKGKRTCQEMSFNAKGSVHVRFEFPFKGKRTCQELSFHLKGSMHVRIWHRKIIMNTWAKIKASLSINISHVVCSMVDDSWSALFVFNRGRAMQLKIDLMVVLMVAGQIPHGLALSFPRNPQFQGNVSVAINTDSSMFLVDEKFLSFTLDTYFVTVHLRGFNARSVYLTLRMFFLQSVYFTVTVQYLLFLPCTFLIGNVYFIFFRM